MMMAVRARGFAPTDQNEADALALPLWATEHQKREMKIPTSPYRCPLDHAPEPPDRSREARGPAIAVHPRRFEEDRRLDITERQFIRRLRERHYGAKENRHA